MQNLLYDGRGEYVIPTTLSQKFTINGRTTAYPVYRVRLDKLYYNDQNDRIATWISQYRSEHGAGAFAKLDREEYNSVIEGFIVQSNEAAIEKTKNNIALVQQRQPGVILADGRVIDGNRRLTCLRQLARQDGQFNWFETVILDSSLENERKQIKLLELAIQHGEEQRVDYNQIDRLVGVYQDIVETGLLTVDEYASGTNEPVTEVKKKVEYSLLLVEFLEYIHMPGQYHIARDYQVYSIIVELYSFLRKCASPEMKEKVKHTVFANVMMRSVADGRKYMRTLSSMLESGFFMTYIREQEKIGAELAQQMQDKSFASEEELDDFICTNEKITDDLRISLDRSVLKAKKRETRNRPSQIVSKSVAMLRDVDTRIFEKLNDSEKENLRSQLGRLNSIVNGIENEIKPDGTGIPEAAPEPSVCQTVVRKVQEKPEPKRYYIAERQQGEPYAVCMSSGKTVTSLNMPVMFTACMPSGGGDSAEYIAFFIDGDGIPLCEPKKFRISPEEPAKVLFTLLSRASQLDSCRLAVKSVNDADDELRQLIRFPIAIAFSADFGF